MNFLFFAIGHFFAVLSPGQTFLGMANMAIKSGFKASLPFVFGISVGNLIFSSIAVFGLSEIIFKNPVFSVLFYFFSGLYLAYFAFKLMVEKSEGKARQINVKKAFFTGLFIEVSNPKSVFFTASLVAIVISPESSLLMQFFVIFWLVFVSLIYEILIILLFATFRNKLMKHLKHINRFFAFFLALFGMKLIISGIQVVFTSQIF
jgi:threonine/homoserine/homoserine lactone efflux protein